MQNKIKYQRCPFVENKYQERGMGTGESSIGNAELLVLSEMTASIRLSSYILSQVRTRLIDTRALFANI